MIAFINTFFKNIHSKILGTSLQRQTKILLFNIGIGLFLITGTTFISLFGLKRDYDSSFLNQEQKLKQLIMFQDIYSSILVDSLSNKPVLAQIKQLQALWMEFNSTQESSNYGTRFKDFYASIFLDYSSKLTKLLESEHQIAQMIDQKIFANQEFDFPHFQKTALTLNSLLHEMIHLRIEILNLKKNSANSLFKVSLILISILLAMIILITLFFSQLIIASIKTLHYSLENTIHQKTKELRDFNQDLQKTIQKEIKESRQKDHIMFQQARLASIGEMIQNIAHQWRQPLNSLILIVQGLKIKFDHNHLSKDFMDTQTQNALRIADNMSHTIENFRNFFQPNTTKQTFGILKGIQDSLTILQHNLQNHNIEVLICPNDEVFLFGYENAFAQVILNLINNAKDAILTENIPNGVIEISFFKQTKHIILEIWDNAGGIKVKEIEKIFEPYFTTKHKSTGTGIGLYMVKQIIEKQMGGEIFAQNQEWTSRITDEKHYGAYFKLVLPNSKYL